MQIVVYRHKSLIRRKLGNIDLIVYVAPEYLCGELRSDAPLKNSYQISEEDSCFVKDGEHYYRKNKIYRSIIDKRTGAAFEKKLIAESNARVMYDISFIDTARRI